MAALPAISNFQDGANGPASNAVAVVFSTGLFDPTFITRGIYVGTAGHVQVLMASERTNDTTYVTFKNVPAGTLLPIRARRIVEVSGTATDMVAVG